MLIFVLCKHDLLKYGIAILLPLVQFDNQRVLDKVVLIMTMTMTISKKGFVKASADKPLGNLLPGDKNLGLETAIRFYSIE